MLIDTLYILNGCTTFFPTLFFRQLPSDPGVLFSFTFFYKKVTKKSKNFNELRSLFVAQANASVLQPSRQPANTGTPNFSLPAQLHQRTWLMVCFQLTYWLHSQTFLLELFARRQVFRAHAPFLG